MARMMLAQLAVLLLVLVMVTMAAADISVLQTVENGCTGDVLVQCKNAKKDYGVQTLTPGATLPMTIDSSLNDPDLTCDFSSAAVPALAVKKTFKLWEYLKSGFIDFPEMACTAGCFWKTQDDGIYYSQAGSLKLFILWADILPGLPV